MLENLFVGSGMLFNPAGLGPIDFVPLLVRKPTPFLEVTHTRLDVIDQEAWLAVGSLPIVMIDCDIREIDCPKSLMDTTAQIKVFQVNKITLIEETHLRKSVAAHHHEAARKISHRERLAVILVPQLVTRHPTFR